MDKEASFKLLDAYYDNGGNSSTPRDESSEKFIGEWAEQRGIRDQLFIATKYTTNFKKRDANITQRHSTAGTAPSRCTSTSVEEVMDNLHNLVVQGKVLYLGISDTPAWIVAKANQYARDHGKTPFVVYQGAWNVMERSFERDIIPMARAEGTADIFDHCYTFPNDVNVKEWRWPLEPPTRDGENGRTAFGPDWERNEDERRMSAALEKVANEVGASTITAVAIAYVMQKVPYVFPIIGGRKVEHLLSNVEALEIALTDEHIAYLESIVSFDPGFPTALFGDGSKYTQWILASGHFDKQPLPQPIRPKGRLTA
ncbi:NADP-dependent oxidoreductase domain-containing protein [Infundibulicybe gibba]|nr:NADP-dependent oxidoreductase domain-containing protein [Infundibulicybe gibba]